MITTVAVSGYRSLVELCLPLAQLTVVTGLNGAGKSNLYRALRLLAAASRGATVAAVSAEGGLASALWAGPESPASSGPVQGTTRSARVQARFGFASDELGYLVQLGLPQIDSRSLFFRDPEIKREAVFLGPFARPAALVVDRDRAGVRVRTDSWRAVPSPLGTDESILTDLSDADAIAEVQALRRSLGSWRFYDQVRTDAGAPARHPSAATRTRALADDGADLAAAWATAIEVGRGDVLDAAVERGFPGARVSVTADDTGVPRLRLRSPGLLRELEVTELSDGTLRYLLLVAALIPARPAPFVVLNEPESSLHPDLVPALADLILTARGDSQVLVVTHSAALGEALGRAGALGHELVGTAAGSIVHGQGMLDAPAWRWL